MRISVITNSYRRSVELVERSLNSSLNLEPRINELIFIDQNILPLPLSPNITNDPRFKRIQTKRTCVSAARNEASFSDDADWIIFCDDDGYFDRDYTKVLIKETNENPATEIYAGSIVRDDNGEYYSTRHKIGGNLMQFRSTKLLMGSNFAIRPATFIRLGKFDTNFGAGSYWGSGEETDFAWKAYFASTKMCFKRELIVYHIRPYANAWKDSIAKAFRYGRGKGALVAKWLTNGKPIVLFELMEMYAVPAILIVKSLLKFKLADVAIHFASVVGRTWGFFRYMLEKITESAQNNENVK